MKPGSLICTLLVAASLPAASYAQAVAWPAYGPLPIDEPAAPSQAGVPHDIAVSPNELLGVAHAPPGSGTTGGVRLYEMGTGSPLGAAQPSPGPVTAPTGGVQSTSILANNVRCLVAGGSPSANIHLYRMTRNGLIGVVALDGSGQPDVPSTRVKDMALSPDGKLAVVVMDGDFTRIYRLGTQAIPAEFRVMNGTGVWPGGGYPSGGGALRAVAVGQSHAVAVGSTPGSSVRLQVYEISSWPPTVALDFTPPLTGGFYDLAITPDGSRAVALQDNRPFGCRVYIFDLTASPAPTLLNGPGGTAIAGHSTAFAQHACGSSVQVGLLESAVLTTNTLTAVLTANDGGNYSGNLHFFDPTNGSPIAMNQWQPGVPHDMAFGLEGDRLVVHTTSEVKIWDTSSPTSPTVLPGGTHSSPGWGYFFVVTNPQSCPNGVAGFDIFVENSVSTANGRAVVIGNSSFAGSTSARMQAYDLQNGEPKPMSSFSNSQYHEVTISRDGYFGFAHRNGLFGPAIDIMELVSGNVLPPQVAAGTAQQVTVNAIAYGSRRVLDVGEQAGIGRSTIVAACPPPQNLFTTNPNSTGQIGSMGFQGSTSYSANEANPTATLVASQLPPGDVGAFHVATQLLTFVSVFPSPVGSPPAGYYYLSSPVIFPSQTIDVTGSASLLLDLSAIPALVGTTFYAQFVFDDSVHGVKHTTDVLDVCIQP